MTDLEQARNCGERAGIAAKQHDQGRVSLCRTEIRYLRNKQKTQADKQAIDTEYTEGYMENSGYYDPPQYF